MKNWNPRTCLLSIFLIIGFKFLCGQEISTIGEIYDYEIGDEFHLHEINYWGHNSYVAYSSLEVINKYYSQINDTIYYDFSRRKLEKSTFNPDWTLFEDSISYKYWDLDSLIQSDNVDSVAIIPELYNGRKLNYVNYNESNWQTKTTYVDGCGRVYRNHLSSNGLVSETENMVYFNKGEEEWGQPIPVLSTHENITSNKILVYPNPATNYITIDLKNGINFMKRIEIYSSQGILIQKSGNIKLNLFTMNIQSLEIGLYYLKIYTKDWINTYKIIKSSNGS